MGPGPCWCREGEDPALVQGARAELGCGAVPCQAGEEAAEHQGCVPARDTQPQNLSPG